MTNFRVVRAPCARKMCEAIEVDGNGNGFDGRRGGGEGKVGVDGCLDGLKLGSGGRGKLWGRMMPAWSDS